MKTIKKLTLISTSIFITSCAGVDNWMIKNTGVNTTDAILIGLNAKERIELTLKEYNAAKARNIPSGKEVVEVSPIPKEEPVVKPTSWIDTIWNMF